MSVDSVPRVRFWDRSRFRVRDRVRVRVRLSSCGALQSTNYNRYVLRRSAVSVVQYFVVM